MTANITNITNIDGIYSLLYYVNHEATGGYFFGILLWSIFFILVIAMRNSGIDKAMLSASFTCLLLSITLLTISLISIIFPILFAVMTAGSAFYIFYSNRQ